MKPDIDTLLKLQVLDQKFADAKASLKHIPQEITALETQIELTDNSLEQEKQKIQALELKRKELDTDLKAAEERIVKFKTQQLQVKKNEEFEALNVSIEAEQQRISDLEDQEINVLLQIDESQEAYAQTEAQGKEKLGELKDQIKTLQKQEKTVEQSLGDLEESLNAAEEAVPQDVLRIYDQVKRIRNKPPYIVAVNEEEHRCQGCYLKVSSNVFSTLVKRETVVQCDQCSRILYIKDEV